MHILSKVKELLDYFDRYIALHAPAIEAIQPHQNPEQLLLVVDFLTEPPRPLIGVRDFDCRLSLGGVKS